jgi:uncharacterized membrane protein YraQ (UPF0718 family)
MDALYQIAQFVANAFLHIWPYLLITIPLAVAVNLSGASRYISRALSARPLLAIVLATAVGAFSPFCSCGVIPVVASLLIGGVPLAPVMAFWVASPSMDPEIFFLSVSVLGWKLALWRLGSTLALSLAAGYITHLLVAQGWLAGSALRTDYSTTTPGTWALLARGGRQVRVWAQARLNVWLPASQPTLAAEAAFLTPTAAYVPAAAASSPIESALTAAPAAACSSTSGNSSRVGAGGTCGRSAFWPRLLRETGKATLMVVQFMLLAFVLEALITLYIPEAWIARILGQDQPWAIVTAALLGVPVYTSNLAAMPLVGGLLAQGMDPAAGLAFLIAGPVTTLPAMAAVWGLTTRRVFALYVLFALLGALVAGFAYALVALV